MNVPPDDQRFAELAAEVRAFAAALPPPLPDLNAPFLDALLAGPFAQVAALLPAWLRDLLPVSEATARRLGAAQLFGWWFAAARDALLDDEGPPELTLGGSLALLRTLAIYGDLGLSALPCWPLINQLEARAAAAYARERAARLEGGRIGPANLAPWGYELAGEATTADRRQTTDGDGHFALVADRAAGLQFAVYAQMDLAGLAPGDPLRPAITSALDRLIIARQLGDDAGDWLHDLRNGRLNTASAAMAHALLRSEGEASVERLAARLTVDELFWARRWELHAACCEAGAQALAPFGPCALSALLGAEASRGRAAAAAGAAWRAEARGMFGNLRGGGRGEGGQDEAVAGERQPGDHKRRA